MLARFRSWVAGVVSRKRLEQELAEELDFHLHARTDDLVRRGLSRPEAARQARLEFGSAERYKEECRESRGLRLLNELRGDVLHAARMLHRSPGFAAVVAVSLALGIGANTAMFSIVYGVLLRPLPYRDQERLVFVQQEMPNPIFSMKTFRFPPEFNVLLRRDEIHSFEDMIGVDTGRYELVDVEEPEDLRAGWVTANMCTFLGVQPVIGRCFTVEQEVGHTPVALLGYSLWQRQFGGDHRVLGRSIQLRDYSGSKSVTVVGVLPPQLQSLWKLDLWLRLSESRDYRNPQWNPDEIVARLKPGVDSVQARAELLAIQRRTFPKDYEGAGGRQIVVLPVADFLARSVKTGLAILLGVVGLVLLITCANVANLLLSRGAGRVREIALRESLGAGRFRVCRQLLTESLTMAVLGGATGLVIGNWTLKGVKALAFQRLPRIEEINMNWTVLGFTALVTMLCGMLIGLLPALRLSRVDLAEAMKAGGAGAIGGRRQRKMMNALVVFEIALCLVAMMGAGLLINTFIRLKGVDPGFRGDRVLVASLNPRGANPGSATSQVRDVLERVQSLPGVQVAGLTDSPPPVKVRSILDFKRPGTADAFGPGGLQANSRVVSPGYFQAMGIPIRRGRAFDERDQSNSSRVIVISEGMARRYWAGDDPVGKTILLRESRAESPGEIVGVAGDVRQIGLRNQPEDLIYSNYTQTSRAGGTLVVRTKGAPSDLAASVKREIRAVDRNQTLRILTTMEQLLADDTAEERFYMILLGAYGVLALALTTLGIGGLVAYSVSRRTQEIGLRISFGATQSNLLWMFASGSLKLVALGLVFGIPISFAVLRFTRSLLYEVTPADLTTYTLVAVLLTLVSLGACTTAAFWATTVEPTEVLRHQ